MKIAVLVLLFSLICISLASAKSVKDMTVKEVLEKIKGWDFSPYDNLIWHYSRIDLLRQLIREEE